MSSLPTSSFSSDPSAALKLTPISSRGDRRLLDEFVGTLADVTCAVFVQLGTGRLSVRDLLSLERHTVLRLGQSAGEDLQVVVHGVSIATGEIVIVDQSTALRVTQIASPTGDGEAS